MPEVQVTAVIPARYGSVRFPGKPLALIAGIPMIERVWRRVRAASTVGRVIVATDDERVASVIRRAGGDAVLTDPSLPSGSDRVAAAAADDPAEFIVNVQGDEPLIDPGHIDAAVWALTSHPEDVMSTLAVPVENTETLWDENVVKVWVDENHRAVCFSRAPLPFPGKSRRDIDCAGYLRHIGLYVFRHAFLDRFIRWAPVWAERVERLEQLRVLYHGGGIRVVEVLSAAPGVDTPADIEIIEALLSKTPQQAPGETGK